MKKLLFILLLYVSVSYSMDYRQVVQLPSRSSSRVPTLVSSCISKLGFDIQVTNAIPEQCDLLAQTIAKTVPKANLTAIGNNENVLDMLQAIANVSQENEFLKITPISFKVKNIPGVSGIPVEVFDKFEPGFLEQRVEHIVSLLYENKEILLFRTCIDTVVDQFYTLSKLQKYEELRAMHPILIQFIERLYNQRESERIESWQKMMSFAFGHKAYCGEW